MAMADLYQVNAANNLHDLVGTEDFVESIYTVIYSLDGELAKADLYQFSLVVSNTLKRLLVTQDFAESIITVIYMM